MCYDSKRDCLWLAPGREVFRYDMKTGQAIKVDTTPPAELGKFAFWREQVHIPEADLILLMRLFKAPDGKMKNVAYDPAENRWYWLELPFVSKGKPHDFAKRADRPFSWNSALLRDPNRRLVLLHNPVTIWALQLDRSSARMSPVAEE
jgi:hypothetical protein